MTEVIFLELFSLIYPSRNFKIRKKKKTSNFFSEIIELIFRKEFACKRFEVDTKFTWLTTKQIHSNNQNEGRMVLMYMVRKALNFCSEDLDVAYPRKCVEKGIHIPLSKNGLFLITRLM